MPKKIEIEVEVELPSRVVSVKMPIDAVARLDAAAQRLNTTRSALIRRAVELCLRELSRCLEEE